MGVGGGGTLALTIRYDSSVPAGGPREVLPPLCLQSDGAGKASREEVRVQDGRALVVF